MNRQIINIVILICMISVPSLTFAENLVLLRKDKESASYYEPDTIRRTQQFVLVWTVQINEGKKHLEYLTEFDCQKGVYRQVSMRIFDDSKVISGDAIYREWFNVPSSNQVLGILFYKICNCN